MEALAHFRHLFQSQPLAPRLDPIYGTVVESFTCQVYHLKKKSKMRLLLFVLHNHFSTICRGLYLGPWNNIELQFLVNKAGPSL